MENFTQVDNQILEKIISLNLSGTAISCFFLLLRKTDGWGKETDGVSLSQFCKAIRRSKPSIIKALSELQLVRIVLLVGNGNSKKLYNSYKINKFIDTWELAKKTKLVKVLKSTSKDSETELVKKPLHTIYTNTKETKQKKKTVKNRKYLIDHKDQIIDEIKKLYPDKNIIKAYSNFISKTEVKDYKYKDYYLALCNWIREDRFNEYSLKQTDRVTRTELPLELSLALQYRYKIQNPSEKLKLIAKEHGIEEQVF